MSKSLQNYYLLNHLKYEGNIYYIKKLLLRSLLYTFPHIISNETTQLISLQRMQYLLRQSVQLQPHQTGQ